MMKATEYRLLCRALLQKRRVILSILLTKATPYTIAHDEGDDFSSLLSVSAEVSFAKLLYRSLLQKRPQQTQTIDSADTGESEEKSSPSSCAIVYGVALVSKIDKITRLFCKRDLYKRRYSAKETYNLIDPTDRSHPIVCGILLNESATWRRGGGLASSTIFKNLMSPTPRRKWYLTTRRRAH